MRDLLAKPRTDLVKPSRLPGVLAVLLACSQAPADLGDTFPQGGDTEDGSGGGGDGTGGDGATDDGGSGDGGSDTDDIKYDVAPALDIPGGDDECITPEHVPCDTDADDPITAMGLNCPGEPAIDVTTTGSELAIGTRTAFGTTDEWNPREGERYTVIGSGLVSDLDIAYDPDDPSPPLEALMACTRDLDDPDGTLGIEDPGPLDPGDTLPLPIVPQDVGAVTCVEDPSLIGTGDCSNTLQGEFDQGTSAHDYTDIRLTATVPDDVTSFSYDLAFFTYEYPDYYTTEYNDLYVAWLESEAWTGNVSFDGAGNPISLNASFLDFKDAEDGTPDDPDCPTGCDAPELHETCMQGHAGTKWLSTTVGVVPGEDVTVVLAIVDLSDSVLDSYVFLDNWRWGCEGTPPETKPVG